MPEHRRKAQATPIHCTARRRCPRPCRHAGFPPPSTAELLRISFTGWRVQASAPADVAPGTSPSLAVLETLRNERAKIYAMCQRIGFDKCYSMLSVPDQVHRPPPSLVSHAFLAAHKRKRNVYCLGRRLPWWWWNSISTSRPARSGPRYSKSFRRKGSSPWR